MHYFIFNTFILTMCLKLFQTPYKYCTRLYLLKQGTIFFIYLLLFAYKGLSIMPSEKKKKESVNKYNECRELSRRMKNVADQTHGS